MGYSIFEDTMADMNWIEIDKASKDGAIVLLPLGVIEEHGPHMCLGTDIYLSYIQCKLIKQRLGTAGIQSLIAPPFYWGINNVSGDFPGSFTSRKETVKAVIYDILASLKRWGFNNVFGVNLHGDKEHCVTLMEGINEARIGIGIRAQYVLTRSALHRFGLVGDEPHILVSEQTASSESQSEYIDVHAGDYETAAMNKYFPEHVNTNLAKSLSPTNLGMNEFMIWRRGWSDARKITPEGYFGDPAGFDNVDGSLEPSAFSIADAIKSLLEE